MRRIVNRRRRRNKYFKAAKAHHKAAILDASLLKFAGNIGGGLQLAVFRTVMPRVAYSIGR
jgi:hypothetical protein